MVIPTDRAVAPAAMRVDCLFDLSGTIALRHRWARAAGQFCTLNDIFGMWWRRSALCLCGIGIIRTREGREHPTIPGPVECTNADRWPIAAWELERLS
jgi:hypothetical protein